MNEQGRRRFRWWSIGVVVAGLLFGMLGLAPDARAVQGNNGTVKIDGLDTDDGPGHSDNPNDPTDNGTDNDPHVKCAFQLEFFNFDAGQTAQITFTARPPTGHKGILYSKPHPISDDDAGGAGNDLDAVIDFNVGEDFDLSKFTDKHDVHGWHIKLTITVYDADGKKSGNKHKVFWAEGCEPDCPEDQAQAAAVADDACNPCVDDPSQAGDQCNPCVDDPNQAGDQCNPCIDDPNQAGDQCNPCVDDPNQAGDQCNPVPGGCPVEGGCAPPPPDACPDMEGVQPEGTDCTPDFCPDMEGEQPEGADCSEVLPAEETPTPVAEPEPVPDEVLGEVVTLPATGSNTTTMVALALALLVLGGLLVEQSRRITAKAR